VSFGRTLSKAVLLYKTCRHDISKDFESGGGRIFFSLMVSRLLITFGYIESADHTDGRTKVRFLSNPNRKKMF
jgi:hypothetical protein